MARRAVEPDRAPVGLPMGTPLLAKSEDAAQIFGISARTLHRLCLNYPDFRALTLKAGHTLLYDVPRCYTWFSQHLGDEVETGWMA